MQLSVGLRPHCDVKPRLHQIKRHVAGLVSKLVSTSRYKLVSRTSNLYPDTSISYNLYPGYIIVSGVNAALYIHCVGVVDRITLDYNWVRGRQPDSLL